MPNKATPIPPNISGEKEETGPKKYVKFIFPKFPTKKSAAANAINIYPIACINLFYLINGVPSR